MMKIVSKFKIDEKVKSIFWWYIVSRLLLLGLLIGLNGLDIAKLFDCEHYINIARNGYSQKFEYAFFPLFPLVIKYLGIAGAIFLNQVAVLGITYFIYRIAEDEFGYDPVLTCKIWLVSPIAMVTIICYTEPLFILFTISAYWLYKKRKKYMLAGILLGLSVATRSTGSMLFFALFIVMFIDLVRKRERFTNIVKMYVPATIISCMYPAYLQWTTGNWKFFVDIQYLYWGKEHSNLVHLISHIPGVLKRHTPTVFDKYAVILILVAPWIFGMAKKQKIKEVVLNIFLVLLLEISVFSDPARFDFIGMILLLIYFIINIVKRRKDTSNLDLHLYMLLSILAITSTDAVASSPTISYYRYIFACFPCYFLLPQKNITINIEMIILSIVSVLFYAGMFFY